MGKVAHPENKVITVTRNPVIDGQVQVKAITNQTFSRFIGTQTTQLTAFLLGRLMEQFKVRTAVVDTSPWLNFRP